MVTKIVDEPEAVATVGSLIRDAIDSLPEGFSAGDVADFVMGRLSPDDYEQALRALIVRVVAAEASNMRRSQTPAAKSFSTKRALIRDQYWPAFLNQHVSLPSGYKRLAEATAEDLLFLAQVRRTQATELVARAEQFERLAEMMTTARVRFLEQLDPKAGEHAIAA